MHTSLLPKTFAHTSHTVIPFVNNVKQDGNKTCELLEWVHAQTLVKSRTISK